MELWRFQRRLTSLLLGWAAASIGTGLVLWRGDDPLRRGVGEQYAGWGVINAIIALVARRPPAQANMLVETAARKRTLSRLLWVNTGLDVLYILGGRRVMRNRGATDARWRGRGLGIVLQGGFLFFFDLLNALALRRVD
ncbi:MAG: hypothetical protein IPH95_07770 [Candidatus Promineofilum sp.]|nr:hypothetical protein [Promineifilum sp.]